MTHPLPPRLTPPLPAKPLLPASSMPCAPQLWLLALIGLLTPSCDAPNLELGRRRTPDAALADASPRDGSIERDADSESTESPDADDREDEDPSDAPRSCDSAAECTGEEPLCNLSRGICVECLRDSDCPGPNERCEAEGECDSPD